MLSVQDKRGFEQNNVLKKDFGTLNKNVHIPVVRLLPNILTSIRLLFSAPVLFYFLFMQNRPLFMWACLFFMVTDILDGNIARFFKVESDWGRKADSLADFIFSLFLFAGTILFLWNQLLPYFPYIVLMVFFKSLPKMISSIRLRRMIFTHLYSMQVYGFLVCILPLYLLVSGNIHPYLFPCMTLLIAILSIEEVLVCLWIQEGDNEGIRSIFELLQQKKLSPPLPKGERKGSESLQASPS